MKGKAVYKRSHNGCLDLLAGFAVGADLPSENELSQSLSVSRTTVRAVLDGLESAGIVTRENGARRLSRSPVPEDHFPDLQTLSTSATVERRFIESILEGRIQAGQLLTSADLARRFGTSTTTIREHLPHLQHLGLIERRPNSAWLFTGVTLAFANEIYDVREMFELRAARCFVALPDGSEPWCELRALASEHRFMLERVEDLYTGFPDLDERTHRVIHRTTDNRFMMEFYNIISILFHYNFRWDVDDEMRRAKLSLAEHLDYFDALFSRNLKAIDVACRRHLRTGRANLLRSVQLRTQRSESSNYVR